MSDCMSRHCPYISFCNLRRDKIVCNFRHCIPCCSWLLRNIAGRCLQCKPSNHRLRHDTSVYICRKLYNASFGNLPGCRFGGWNGKLQSMSNQEKHNFFLEDIVDNILELTSNIILFSTFPAVLKILLK